MNLDEQAISDALHAATDEFLIDADLARRVREGGRRRLRHGRIGAVAGVMAIVAAIVPAAIALAPGGQDSTNEGSSPTAGLYASPPASSACNFPSSAALPSAYPQLLMLPTGQSVNYAFANNHQPGCPPAHVALTLVDTSNGKLVRALVVDGPNAPSATEAGYGGSGGAKFDGLTLRPDVGGQPAMVFYIASNSTAEVFWSGAEGDQWQAKVRGLTPSALTRLLRHLDVNPQTGTATVRGAPGDGWTVEPTAPDAVGDPAGIFYARWDEDGARVAMTVMPGPDRTDQIAATLAGSRQITIQGQPAVVGLGGSVIWWQTQADVTVYLTAPRRDAARLQQIAATIEPISPTDPRLHRP